LGIGVFHNLLTLTYATPVIKALELLSAYKVSSIPIVDEHMRPVDVYTRSDVRYLALDQTWTNLEMTIEEALSKHRVSSFTVKQSEACTRVAVIRYAPATSRLIALCALFLSVLLALLLQRGRCLGLCSRDDSIHTVSGLLVASMRHSLICVHPDGTIEGVVSLTDIFSFLLNANAPATAAESRIAALMKDYAQFEAQERAQAEALAAQAAAQAAQDGSSSSAAAAVATGQAAASDGSGGAHLFASPRVSPTIKMEERLRQQTFLAEHGQAGDDEAAERMLLEEAAAFAATATADGTGRGGGGGGGGGGVNGDGDADDVAFQSAESQGGMVDPAALQSAIAAGTVSALPHPERLKQHLSQKQRGGGGTGGNGGAATAAGGNYRTGSPAIKPSEPNDGVNPAEDYAR
jgi:CBS domain-containing protein